MATRIFRWRMTAHQPCPSISAHHLCARTCDLICNPRGSIPSMPSETPDARSDSTLTVDTGSRHTPPAQSPRLTRCRISIHSRQIYGKLMSPVHDRLLIVPAFCTRAGSSSASANIPIFPGMPVSGIGLVDCAGRLDDVIACIQPMTEPGNGSAVS